MKDDAIAQLSDQVMALTARMQEFESSTPDIIDQCDLTFCIDCFTSIICHISSIHKISFVY
jgi:hypothetical protein